MPAPVRDQRIQTTCLLILSGVALALSLYWLRNVMVPFVLAVFLSFALAPLVDVLIRRARMPRALALSVTILAALASMLFFGGLVTNSVRNMAPNMERLEDGILELVDRASTSLGLDELQRSIAEWTREEEGTAAEADPDGGDAKTSRESSGSSGDGARGSDTGRIADAADAPDAAGPGAAGDAPAGDDGAAVAAVSREEADAAMAAEFGDAPPAGPVPGDGSLISAIGRRIVPAIGSVLNGITTLLSKSVLVLIFLMFLLGGRREFDIRENKTTLGVVERQVRSYLLTKIIASLATGVLTAIALRMIGVPSALLFGLLAFLLNFIPSIGSILAALLPLPMALVTFDLGTSEGVIRVVMTLAIPGGIQFLIGNVIEPKVMGDSLDLHPVVVMLSLIFWGTIWGPIGMLLATPITAVVKLMLEKLEPTQPIARAMAGKIGG